MAMRTSAEVRWVIDLQPRAGVALEDAVRDLESRGYEIVRGDATPAVTKPGIARSERPDDRRFRMRLARALGDDAIALGERSMLDGARPRSGETGSAAIVRRFQEYGARCAIEGRAVLPFDEWLRHDRTLNEAAHTLAERESQAPQLEAAERQRKVLAEIDGRARQLMAKDAALSLASARTKVMADNPTLSEKYRRSTLGLPDQKEG